MVVLLVMIASAALAAAGDLDDTFSGDGKKTTNIQGQDRAHAVLALPNGKILVGGESNAGIDRNFALVRYRHNGALDRDFSGDGIKTTNFGGDESAIDIARQDDGKILAVGGTFPGAEGNIAIARYKPNGALDKSFSADGKVTTNLGDSEEATDVSILPNGKIIVAGDQLGETTADLLVLRYNPNGKLDTNSDSNPSSAFSQDGWRTIDFPAADSNEYCYGLDVRNGKITVVGYVDTGTLISTDFAIARLKSGGGMDNTFDTDGRAIVDFEGQYDNPYDVKMLGNGKTVVVGEGASGGLTHFAFTRLTEDGAPDPTFGSGGERLIALNGGTESGRALSLEVQSDGKYVAVGRSDANNRFALMRLKKNGDPDTTFGGGGEVETNIGDSSSAGASDLDADGKIVAVGKSTTGTNDNFALARYLP